MKLFFADTSVENIAASFGILPDSCLLRNNDSFFVPNFSDDISAYACLIVKIHKLGKCFAPRFSNRYYKEFTLGVNFVAQSASHSQQICTSFDKSLAVGKMSPLEGELPVDFRFQLNGETHVFALPEPNRFVDEAFSSLSQYFTFKIGDLAVFSLGSFPSKVVKEDLFEASYGSGLSFFTAVK